VLLPRPLEHSGRRQGNTTAPLIALTQDEWLWGTIISSASVVAEVVVVLARRRRARRSQTP
jgi:hypothetical protein